MKNEQQIKDYLSDHYFINRIHAHAVRAVLMDKFKTREFEFKITSCKSIEYKSVKSRLITANDAINYIWDDEYRIRKLVNGQIVWLNHVREEIGTEVWAINSDDAMTGSKKYMEELNQKYQLYGEVEKDFYIAETKGEVAGSIQ